MRSELLHRAGDRYRAWLLITLLCLGCHPPLGAAAEGATALRSGALLAATLEAPAPPRDDPAPRRLVLDNGARVVLLPRPGTRVVALQAWFDVGAADDPEDLPGAAHLFEHVLLRGSARRPPGQAQREIDAVGGVLRASTTPDHTRYEVVVASRFFSVGLDVLADALTRPAFDPSELAREVRVITDEIRRADADPERMATQALLRTAFAQHPYRRPLLGTVASLGRVTRAQLARLYEASYNAARLTLVLTGDFDPARAPAQLAQAFAPLHRGLPRKPRAADPPQRGLRVAVPEADLGEARLLLGFRTGGSSEDLAALDLAAVLLGHGEDARLLGELRRNLQVASATQAYAFTPGDNGLFVVGATVLPQHLGEAAHALLRETLRLCREEVPPGELRRAHAALEADAVYGRETASGLAGRLGYFATHAAPLDEAAYWQAVRTLTSTRLRAALCRVLSPESLSVVALVPKAAAAPRAGAERPSTRRARVLLRAVTPQDAAETERLLHRVVAAVAREAPANAATAAAPVDGQVVAHRLRAGPKVLILPQRDVPLVALRAEWSGGLALEDERTVGVSELLARLLVRGTQTRSAEQVRREAASLSGEISGFAGARSLGLSSEVVSAHWERALALLVDCLKNPALREDDVEIARRQVLELLREREESGAQVALRLFQQAFAGRRAEVQTPAQSVAALSRRRLLEHYRRGYPLDRLTLVVVGDAEPAQVIARLEALLPPVQPDEERPGSPAARAIPAASAMPTAEAPTAPPPLSAVQVFKYQNKDQAHLIVGFPGASPRDPDQPALAVVAAILAGQGGRIFRELRDNRGRLYRTSALPSEEVAPPYVGLYLATAPDNVESAQAAVWDELRKLLDHPVPAAELEGVKRHLVGVHERVLQRRSQLAAALCAYEAAGLGWDGLRGYPDAVLRVTAEDVRRAARRFLDQRRAVIAAVLPERMTPAASRREVRQVLPPPSIPLPEPAAKSRPKAPQKNKAQRPGPALRRR